MSRRNAREAAMKLLYQYSITDELALPEAEESGDLFSIEKLDGEDRDYINGIIADFESRLEEIDAIISENSYSWKIDRISKVDLAILRLAIYEIKNMGMPEKVAVNEAVELAKKFSGDKSYKYVNGLLGGFLKKEKAMAGCGEPNNTL